MLSHMYRMASDHKLKMPFHWVVREDLEGQISRDHKVRVAQSQLIFRFFFLITIIDGADCEMRFGPLEN